MCVWGMGGGGGFGLYAQSVSELLTVVVAEEVT